MNRNRKMKWSNYEWFSKNNFNHNKIIIII
jgi:hypothetical protein